MKEGLSGNIAKAFIQSKLTILLMIGFLLIGGYSTMLIPREEEPQIDVPMADIFLRYPGASPKEVEARVAQPLEKIISNIKGVEYVYSTSMKGTGNADRSVLCRRGYRTFIGKTLQRVDEKHGQDACGCHDAVG
jgi:Cu/Ag efflux pump CusA